MVALSPAAEEVVTLLAGLLRRDAAGVSVGGGGKAVCMDHKHVSLVAEHSTVISSISTTQL